VDWLQFLTVPSSRPAVSSIGCTDELSLSPVFRRSPSPPAHGKRGVFPSFLSPAAPWSPLDILPLFFLNFGFGGSLRPPTRNECRGIPLSAIPFDENIPAISQSWPAKSSPFLFPLVSSNAVCAAFLWVGTRPRQSRSKRDPFQRGCQSAVYFPPTMDGDLSPNFLPADKSAFSRQRPCFFPGSYSLHLPQLRIGVGFSLGLSFCGKDFSLPRPGVSFGQRPSLFQAFFFNG